MSTSSHIHSDKDDASSSSSSSSSLSSSPFVRPTCNTTVEELRADFSDLTSSSACPNCTHLVHQHRRSTDVTPFPSTHRRVDSAPTSANIHIAKLLPQWDARTQSFHAFLAAVENVFVATSTPEPAWTRSLLFCFSNVTEQNWVKTNIIDTFLDWTEATAALRSHFQTSNYQYQLQMTYEVCRQEQKERVQSYGDRFKDVCAQLLVPDDSSMAINHFINGLSMRVKQEFHRRIDIAQAIGSTFARTSLLAVIDAAIKIDNTEFGIIAAYSSSSPSPSSSFHTSSSTPSTPTRRSSLCAYHPSSTTHTTAECSRNPRNMRDAHTSPARPRVFPFPNKTPSSSPSPSFSTLPSLSPATPSPVKAPPTCYNCGEVGHYVSRCTKPRRTPVQTRARSSVSAVSVVEEDEEEEENEQEQTSTYEGQAHSMYNVESRDHGYTPNLSRAEYDRCTRERRCFNCKQHGHLSRNCPLPKNEQGRRH